MVQIQIGQGQGITQAIKAQIIADGGKITNNNLSVWQSVMNEVKTANNNNTEGKNSFYTGGDDVSKIGDNSTWGSDFKTTCGQVIELAQDVWNRIVEALTGKKPEAETSESETPQETAPTLESQPETPQETAQPENTVLDDTTVISDNEQVDVVADEIVSEPAVEEKSSQVVQRHNPVEIPPETVTNHPPVYYNADNNPSQDKDLTAEEKSSQVVQRQEPMEIPPETVTNHPPVYYNADNNPSQDKDLTAEEKSSQVVQRQEPVEIPPETVTNHPPVYYNADNNPPQNKDLTAEDIEDSIANLKPGETFAYRHTEENYSITGYSRTSISIKWIRNDDNTLTNIVPVQLIESGHFVHLSTKYEADGKTKISEEVVNNDLASRSAKFAEKTIKSVINYENGKPAVKTTDLANSSVSNLYVNLIENANIYSSQMINDSKGETIVTYRDGKFFDKKGKEIDEDKAFSILEKASSKNKLGNLIQNY